MADTLSPSLFPSLLGSPSILGVPPSGSSPPRGHASPKGGNVWKDLFSKSNDNTKAFSLNYCPSPSDEVLFSQTELDDGKLEWDLSLVGYAIGRRPYYGHLSSAVKRKWTFKGEVELLTLDGGFFLFKFNCKEDYDMVWDHGPCFLNGRPFIFQQWSWDFHPTRANLTEIPVWIKLPNFPLCCWNEGGFSKVASKVGIPLAVDNLTASKARITFARVCVQVNTASPLPDSVNLNLNGILFKQDIIYDWKPKACSTCATFSHEDSNCPKNKQSKPPVRSRSRSRPPQRVAPTPPSVMDHQVLNGPPPSLPSSSSPPILTSLTLPSSSGKGTTDLNLLPILSPPLDPILDVNVEDLSLESSQDTSEDPSPSSTSPSGVVTRAKATPSKDNGSNHKSPPSSSKTGKHHHKKKKKGQKPSNH